MDIIVEIGLIILLTTVIAAIMKLLKQPLIIGYIISGVIAGPYFLNMIQSADTIYAFSHIGVAFLLFIVGLSLSPEIIRQVGKVSVLLGLGQVVSTVLASFFISRLLGFSTVVSAYVSVALTFSSTIIVMKLLSDKNETETLFGKISLGLLIFQDVVAMLVLMFISAVPNGFDVTNILFGIVLKGGGLLLFVFLLGFYVLPMITRAGATSQEFMFLFSISWCLTLSALFSFLNFSMEIGALLAGISLSFSPYRYELGSRMRTLRDFFIILFFIVLGSQIMFTDAVKYIPAIVIASVFVMVGKPLIIMILLGTLGYRKRNSFMTGINMAQISEFSFIIFALGNHFGHFGNDLLSIVTLVGLITISGSAYMIMHSNRLYASLSKYLGVFERRANFRDEINYRRYKRYDVILFGYNRIGYDVLESLKRLKKRVLVVDYNPETISALIDKKVDCKYGDVSDSEFLNEINFSSVKMAISTIPSFEINVLLIDEVKRVSKKAIIIVVSHQIEEAISLYDKGATYVIMPHFLGGNHISTLIRQYRFNLKKFLRENVLHFEHLKKRKEMGHEHPKHERH